MFKIHKTAVLKLT